MGNNFQITFLTVLPNPKYENKMATIFLKMANNPEGTFLNNYFILFLIR